MDIAQAYRLLLRTQRGIFRGDVGSQRLAAAWTRNWLSITPRDQLAARAHELDCALRRHVIQGRFDPAKGLYTAKILPR